MLTASDMAGKTVCMEQGFSETFFNSNFPGVGIKKILKPTVFECYPTLQGGQVGWMYDCVEHAFSPHASLHCIHLGLMHDIHVKIGYTNQKNPLSLACMSEPCLSLSAHHLFTCMYGNCTGRSCFWCSWAFHCMVSICCYFSLWQCSRNSRLLYFNLLLIALIGWQSGSKAVTEPVWWSHQFSRNKLTAWWATTRDLDPCPHPIHPRSHASSWT